MPSQLFLHKWCNSYMFWFRGSLVQIKYSILNEIRHIINLFKTFLYSTLIFCVWVFVPVGCDSCQQTFEKKQLWLNFNFCVSGYFKCSMITRDSTNMLKRISSSPVFFYSPPTSFTNNVLCIDRSPYHPKTKLEFFFIESNAAGTFSRTPRNHFSIFSRFQPSNIEKKSRE